MSQKSSKDRSKLAGEFKRSVLRETWAAPELKGPAPVKKTEGETYIKKFHVYRFPTTCWLPDKKHFLIFGVLSPLN